MPDRKTTVRHGRGARLILSYGTAATTIKMSRTEHRLTLMLHNDSRQN